MPWFAQGVDAANGPLVLRRALLNNGECDRPLDWTVATSRR